MRRITPYRGKTALLTTLPDLGTGRSGLGNNNRGQIVGTVGSADNTTQTGALWQNQTLTTLGLLPGDLGGIATGINSKGQVVGSNWDSSFNWSHAFIWEDNVMTDLNTLFPASSNLCAVMANKINERGQISGMAIVRSGPDAGNIHAFLATPAHQSMGRSVAEVAPTCPKSNLPANVGNQLCRDSYSADSGDKRKGFVPRVCAFAVLGSFPQRECTHSSPPVVTLRTQRLFALPSAGISLERLAPASKFG